MLNIENVNVEQIEEGKALGYVVDAGAFENEEAAEKQGFYWFDEVGYWINVEEFKNLV